MQMIRRAQDSPEAQRSLQGVGRGLPRGWSILLASRPLTEPQVSLLQHLCSNTFVLQMLSCVQGTEEPLKT